MDLTQGQKINFKKALSETKKGHFITLKSTFHIQDVTGMNIYTTNKTQSPPVKTNTTRGKVRQKHTTNRHFYTWYKTGPVNNTKK